MRGRPVCITGVGAISAAGRGVDGLRALVCAGATRVRPDRVLAGLPVGRAPDPPRSAAARRLEGTIVCYAARDIGTMVPIG